MPVFRVEKIKDYTIMAISQSWKRHKEAFVELVFLPAEDMEQ